MTLLGLPFTQEASRHDKFACVVAFVPGDQQGFARKILAVTPQPGAVYAGEAILHDSRVLPMNHEDRLFQLPVVLGIGEAWEGIEAKLYEVQVSLGMNHVFGI